MGPQGPWSRPHVENNKLMITFSPSLILMKMALDCLLVPAINYYHKALHLGCCSSPRSASESITYSGKTCQSSLPSVPSLPRSLSLQCLMYISDFHSDENSSSNYSWNPYERESQLSLPKEVEKH